MTSTEATTATVTGRAIQNPELAGFHPDPSILRVGSDYYIATSTFEWYPGVRLHHSTNLVDWTPLGGALNEKRLLDLTGAADSGGVWAPSLTYAHGQFHLLYTDVSTFAGGYFDPQNYLVTAPSPSGPWSDPVVLHGRGFDASLFHDEDGSTWMLSMVADARPGHNRFAGISIQRYDRDARKLTGAEHMIFKGTAAKVTEAPNLYRKDGWYYLVTAEGGTSWEHQVTVARSRAILGPYEADPAGPLLTSNGHPELALQKAGHGSLVETPAGQWYLAHLVGRPYSTLGRCVLGRESAIQEVTWSEDGWPRIAGGIPADTVPAPLGVTVPAERPVSSEERETDDFDAPPGLGFSAPPDGPGAGSGTVRVVPDARVEVTGLRRLGLKLRLAGEELSFAYATEPDRAEPEWTPIGPSFDATTLSDEYAAKVVAGEPEAWGFTGAFVGLWVQDLGAEGGYADFDRATYKTSG